MNGVRAAFQLYATIAEIAENHIFLENFFVLHTYTLVVFGVDAEFFDFQNVLLDRLLGNGYGRRRVHHILRRCFYGFGYRFGFLRRLPETVTTKGVC